MPQCLLLTQSGRPLRLNGSRLNRYDCSNLTSGEAMRRRHFIAAVGAAISVQPIRSLAQGPRPVVGLISSTSPQAYASRIAAFNRGLEEAGYTDGKNVTIEYRWAEGHYDRLASLAAGSPASQRDCGNHDAGRARRKGRDNDNTDRV